MYKWKLIQVRESLKQLKLRWTEKPRIIIRVYWQFGHSESFDPRQ